jgi:hypothetical protein
VNVLQTLYDDKLLSPPSTHTLKYVDEDGDSITVVTSNDLELAISYSSKLTRPILRLAIEKKSVLQNASQVSTLITPIPQQQTSTPLASNTPSSVLSPTFTSTPVSYPTLKIEGRAVQRPAEIKERYGPKKDPLPTQSEIRSNTNESKNNPLTFSCQNFSAETRKKNLENSTIITSSQKQLGEQTAKEIDDFASDISKTFKNIAYNSNLNAEKRGSIEKESLAESVQSLTCSNLIFPENGFDVTESTFAKFKGLSSSTIDEQAKEIDAIKEHHSVESGKLKKKNKDLHESTVSLVVREASNLI